MGELKFDCEDLKYLFMQIGLANPSGNSYKERLHKHGQLEDYYIMVKSVLNKVSTKKPVVLLDCGCGRSYLSFYLNYQFQQEGRTNLHFVGIDTNEDLIEKCAGAARELEFTNMEFHSGSIIECKIDKKPDVVYSLHACDFATDQMIARGVLDGARYILSVSCCQHTARSQISKHPLTSITRFKPYKERIVDMVSDSMRGLLLESLGYNVDIFEFVPTKSTPKNIMLRAAKGSKSQINMEKAAIEYIKLSKMFNIHPGVETYLKDILQESSSYYKEVLG